jgi:hypothetical protein
MNAAGAAMVGALTLLVSGCAGGGAEAAAPVTVTATQTVTATVTVTPKPTTWSTAEAGKKYLSYLGPVNKANRALNQTPRDASVEVTAKACQAVVDAELVFVAQLRKGSWPKDANADIDRLVDAMGDEIAGYTICAQSYTYESIDTGIQKALSAPVGSAAAQVRVALDLPAKSS